MGNCGSGSLRQLSYQYPKEAIHKHFIALAKLEHYEKRAEGLRLQAQKEVEKIINTSLTHIDRQETLMCKEKEDKIKQLKRDEVYSKELIQKHESLENYVGLTALKQNFGDYREKATHKFATIQKQMDQNMDNTFQKIKNDLQGDLLKFQMKNGLQPNDIEMYFTRMKTTHKQEVRVAQLDVQNLFRQELVPVYFKKKLKDVVSLEDIKELGRSRISKIEVESLKQSTEPRQIMISEIHEIENRGCCGFSFWK